MGRESLFLRFRDGELRLDHTAIMGIVNVTPDSFSDGGRFLDSASAVEHALRLAGDGAAILDIGGESTRPGSDPIPAEEEWRRIAPVLNSLRSRTSAHISIDTYKPAIAAKALALGADMVNDVHGLRDPKMIRLVASADAAAVVMHMKGVPKAMQHSPSYEDVVLEISEFLAERTRAAIKGGVTRDSLVVDPGLGFGKTPEHNMEILRRLAEFRRLDFPLLAGTSGKLFITGRGKGEDDRPMQNVASAALAAENGADIVRVHDVAATAKAIRSGPELERGAR